MDIDEAVVLQNGHQPGPRDWNHCGTCGDEWPCRPWRLAAVEVMEAVRDRRIRPFGDDDDQSNL